METFYPHPPKPYKCLSIGQPWAWLIVAGHKTIENRFWHTSYRGPLLIHASKSRDFLDRYDPDDYDPPGPAVPHHFTFGAIVGCVKLLDCVPLRAVRGTPFAEGPWCFVLGEPVQFAEPIPYRGQQKLFDVPADALRDHGKFLLR